eukprot:6951321-Karenia_brevis.AAC.1
MGDDEERQLALRRWMKIVEGLADCSADLNMVAGMEDYDDKMALLDDILYDRRPKTLVARAGSIEMFIRWHRASCGGNPFPLTEETTYRYLKELYVEKAPATRAQRFREAIAFLKHVMGVEGCDDILSSRRIQGAALRSFMTKRLRKQRDALTVEMVRELENIVTNEMADVKDRCFAGFALSMVYLRARHFDLSFAVAEPRLD